jgi:KaiC/GvpD/RAD55 family RecA-like ATPase
MLDKVPDELRECRQWVVWKTVTRDGLPTKLPFQANGGAAAKSNDPQTWCTFEEASIAFERGGYSGVGFVFSESDEFCGIDLDGCRDPETGKYAEWAKEILAKLNSYSEVSPSKTGAKVFVRGKSPWGAGKKFSVFGAEKICDKAPAIEVYDRLRYFAVTGLRIGKVSVEVEPRQDELQWLADKYGPKDAPAVSVDWSSDAAVVERARSYLAKLPLSVSGHGGHNAAFHAACVLAIDFGLSDGDAIGLLREWNAGCHPPWSDRDLVRKVSEALKQPGERNRLRNARQENWSKIRVEPYRPKPTESLPSRTTLEEAARKRLGHEAKGISNLMELGLPDLDYALEGGVEPGEMVILAARPSHGKSAVALQAIHHVTSNGIRAAMVSEEMSTSALGKRVLQFASTVPQEHWKFSSGQVEAELDQHFKSRVPCIVIESCRTAERAAEAIRRAVNEDGVRFAVVDYAQILGSKGNGRYEQVTQTSVILRQLASETGIVLLVLCQLSRAIETRQKFVPTTSDLKDTGQLEQDADVIVFLVWPHRIDPKNSPDEYLFFVSKNRNRAINAPSLRCTFKPSRQMLVSDKSHGRPGGAPAKGTAFNPGDWLGVETETDEF